MRRKSINLTAATAGVLLMLPALVNALVTLTGGRYGPFLIESLVEATLAVGCLAVPLVRGPLPWRIAAVLLASPWLFVAGDFLRRGPFVFGR